MDMYDIYIVQVVPAAGWGEDYFYCYHSLENARTCINDIARQCGMDLLNPDFAMRVDNFDHKHHIAEVKLSEEFFED